MNTTTGPGPQATPSEIADILGEHDSLLVVAHGNADGDAVGAMSAMGYLLKAMGKRFALYNATGVPPYLEWLRLPGTVYTRLSQVPFKPELIVVLDCGDLWRVGNELADVFANYPSVNIDHHLGNDSFGSLGNLTVPDAAATGQLVAVVAEAAGFPLTGGLAEGVYISLVSDTGSFSFGNTTPDVLELTARMMRLGLDVQALRNELDSQWTMAKARLWGRLFTQGLRLEDEGRIALCEVGPDDFAQTGAVKSDLEQFVEQMRSFVGVRVALLVREDYPRKIKISLRSRGDDDVRQIAVPFGGGGHKNAAGATLDMPRPEAVPKLLEMIRASLNAE